MDVNALFKHYQDGNYPHQSLLPARSGGECVICGLRRTKSQVVLRALYEDYDQDEPKKTGYKVCTQCSPHVSDQTVERYVYGSPDDDWPWRWRMNLDAGVFSRNGETVRAEW